MEKGTAVARFDGARLRRIREKKGWSRQELAQRTVPPLSRAYIYLLEGSEDEQSAPRRPSYDVVLRLAEALGVTPDAFAAPSDEAEGSPVSYLRVAHDAAPTPAIPSALLEAARRFHIPETDVGELARFSFRGLQPQSPADWAHLWMAIVNSVGTELS